VKKARLKILIGNAGWEAGVRTDKHVFEVRPILILPPKG